MTISHYVILPTLLYSYIYAPCTKVKFYGYADCIKINNGSQD
jgi:hypothetical protein